MVEYNKCFSIELKALTKRLVLQCRPRRTELSVPLLEEQ